MKAAIINPYLDTLGGGERYTLAFAKALINSDYQVDLEWKNKEIVGMLEDRFGMDLEGINIVGDTKRGDSYDLCFWVSDGSIPILKARNNILHFQVPFHGVGGGSLLNKMKLIRVNKIVCNSGFTKSVIDKEFGVKSVVIYPSVDTENIKPKRKENLILYVGRFSNILQSKSQDVLIKAFIKMYKGGLTDWKLVLIGGVEVGVGDYLESLKKLSSGYPIEIIESPDFKTLKDYYGKAKIFWSASGYGVNEEKSPERVEHFGITVIEAMAGGAVPIIYNAGGHKEIVEDGKNGFLWDNTNKLIEKTKEVMSSRMTLSKNAISSSKGYSYEKFNEGVVSLISANSEK